MFNYIIKKDKVKELAIVFWDYEIKFVTLMVKEETIIKRDRDERFVIQ